MPVAVGAVAISSLSLSTEFSFDGVKLIFSKHRNPISPQQLGSAAFAVDTAFEIFAED
jgi:hypothetical protein